jgi:hypothetical protein
LQARQSYISRYEAALSLRLLENAPEAALEQFRQLQQEFPHDPAIAWQIRILCNTRGEDPA